VQLPQSAPATGDGIHRSVIVREAKVAADGSAVVQLGSPQSNEVWYVDRLVVQAPDSAAGTCRAFVYAGEINPTDLLDAAQDASFATADNVPAWIVENAPLTVVFAGAVPTKLVYARAQITRVQQ
jgi:hypothetical protein